MIRPIYWELFSKKIKDKLDHLRFVGFFLNQEAKEKGMRLVVGKESHMTLYCLVDETDGVVADVKFQAFGPIGLLAVAEVSAEMILRKNYQQISRMTAELIDYHVRDTKQRPAFPKECDSYLNEALMAMDRIVAQCQDLPCEEVYEITPIENDFAEIEGGIEGFSDFPKKKKMQIIEEVIDKEIRPYIELDAGGIKLLDLKENHEVLISYEGACTTCHASTGSTLTAIQKILRARVFPEISVIPEGIFSTAD